MDYINIFNDNSVGEIISYKDGKPKVKKIKQLYYKSLTRKGDIKSIHTFLEPIVMEYFRRCNLNAPRVIAIRDDGNTAIFITEKVKGIKGPAFQEKFPSTENILNKYLKFLKIAYHNVGIDCEISLDNVLINITKEKLESVTPLTFNNISINNFLDRDKFINVAEEFGIKVSLPRRRR